MDRIYREYESEDTRLPRLANARPRARDEDDAERARASVIRTLARLPARRVARSDRTSTPRHPRRQRFIHVDAMSTETCVICLTTREDGDDAHVMCESGAHGLCRECFGAHVREESGKAVSD